MTPIEQWRAAGTTRALLYRWFAELIAHELPPKLVGTWRNEQAYDSIHQAFSLLGLQKESTGVENAVNNLSQLPEDECALELAADFAQVFLLNGRESAPPYASYYLHEHHQLFATPAIQMRRFLEARQLKLHPEFREPDDHLSVYLTVMSQWIDTSTHEDDNRMIQIAHEQADFLDTALRTWLAQFVQQCQKIQGKTNFYPALTLLLQAFIEQDYMLLRDFLCTQQKYS